MTRAGLKATSTPPLTFSLTSQSKILFTSFSLTWKLSQFLTADSSKTLMEYGSLAKNKDIYVNYQKLKSTKS